MQSPIVTPQEVEWSDLLASARAGNDAALGEICERLRSYLLLTAAGDLGRDLTAKFGASDVVQETMLEACRDFCSFRGNSEQEYRVWIRRLLERNLIDSARRYRESQCRQASRETSLQGARRELEPIGREGTASRILQLQETDAELLRAVARLPQQQRQVIDLRHRRGLSHAEIARELDMTEVAVRKVWSRAIATLSKEINVDDESPETSSR